MSSEEKDHIIQGHDYDGIQELNNPLPGWWLMTFYITIVFSVVYYSYYTFFGGLTSDQELAQKMSVIRAEQQAQVATSEKSEEYYLSLLDKPEVIEAGKNEYMLKCMPCHGNLGQGLIGPNFTDDYWIHGNGSITAILEVANNGVPDKGMVPWRGVIPEETLEAVSAYIYTLRGTNPTGAKPPQGEKVETK